MPHPATVYAFGHMFTKSKNKAALKDPNPNYLQQRTLLTYLQTSNYLAYQMGGGGLLFVSLFSLLCELLN